MNTNRRSQPLYRDPNDKTIGGVCSGLGRYFDVDTVLIRIGFVVATLLSGSGVVAYLLLWGILDPVPPGHAGEPNEPRVADVGDDAPQGCEDQVEQPLDPIPTTEALGSDEA